MKVLIIEDHPIDLKLAQAVIQVSGHHSMQRTAADGALEVILSYRPDVILLDLNLPGTDGVRFARDLQENLHTRSIPIVAVTAYPQEYGLARVLSAGCSLRIVKPINTRNLVSQLEAIVANGGPGGLP